MIQVMIRHQPEHGIQEVVDIKDLEEPITLWDGKVIDHYYMVGSLGGYHRDSLEFINYD